MAAVVVLLEVSETWLVLYSDWTRQVDHNYAMFRLIAGDTDTDSQSFVSTHLPRRISAIAGPLPRRWVPLFLDFCVCQLVGILPNRLAVI